jgi:hypothetical protein
MGSAIGGAVKVSSRPPVGRLAVGSIGIVMIGIGIRGIVNHSADTHPRSWVIWIVAAALGDDLVVIPVMLVIGAIVMRVVPMAVRSVVQVALMISAAVSAIGIVGILASNRRIHSDNPSLLPLPYVRNLLIVLAAIWFVAALVATIVVLRHRSGLRMPSAQGE